MRPRPPSTISDAVQRAVGAATPQPLSCTIRAVGAKDCAALLPDGSILRGVRVVGPRPAVGDSAWLMWDAAGPYVTSTGAASEGGAGVAIVGGGTVNTGTVAHGLADTSVHTGTLADAQATQFPKLDGSRAFNGQTIPFEYSGAIKLKFTNTSTGKSCSIVIDGDTFVFDGKISAPFLETALIDAIEILADRIRAEGVEGHVVRAIGTDYTEGFVELVVEGDRARIWTDRGAIYANETITLG